MIRRILTLLLIVVLGWWAASAAYTGAGATGMYPAETPAEAQQSYENWLEEERARLQRADDDRRYRAGQMAPAEAAAYATLLAREAAAEAARRERERQAYLRNVQRSRSGGGSSSGK